MSKKVLVIRQCANCGGTGKVRLGIHTKTCLTCRGSGVVTVEEEVSDGR